MKYHIPPTSTPMTSMVAARVDCVDDILRAPLFAIIVTSACSTR